MLADKARAASSVEGWNLAFTTEDFGTYGYVDVSAQSPTPEGLFFKSDGTKMYVLSNSGDDVNEYDLSLAWDVSTATYAQNFSVSAQENSPLGMFFKPDGTKMYVVGSGSDSVNEYDLSSAWDISTATYVQNFSVFAQDGLPRGVFFKDDGTKMYVLGGFGDDVNEYTLSSGWDVSTATYVQNFSVSAQESVPTDLFFKSDGTTMYVVGSGGDNVYEYTLSSAWNIGTASFSQNFSVRAQTGSPYAVYIKADGLKMYVSGGSLASISDAIVASYALSSAWDIGSAAWDAPAKNYFSVFAQETAPWGLAFKSDGTKCYVLGVTGDDVNEYNLSSDWDISTATFVQSFSIAAQELDPRGLFFKADGTKMYVVGSDGDDVNEYTLSSAWDVSTAAYVQNFSVASQDTSPRGVFFKNDGTKMYVCGTSSASAHEYNLSSAWDISTASYVQSFSTASQDTAPQGLYFKPDGTRMYVAGGDGYDILEYNLSSAWDISSATYTQNFVPGVDVGLPTDVAFKADDGTKMFVLSSDSDAIWAYNL